jgi:hypothetical protein
MTKEIQSDIGFADGEIQNYLRDDSNVTVNVKAWNGETVQVICRDTIGIEDHGLGEISALTRDVGSTPLLDRVLAYFYEVTPQEHPYSSYQFQDLDGDPRLEIIAQSVEVRQL